MTIPRRVPLRRLGPVTHRAFAPVTRRAFAPVTRRLPLGALELPGERQQLVGRHRLLDDREQLVLLAADVGGERLAELVQPLGARVRSRRERADRDVLAERSE